jgi:hypothetical protein
MDSSGGVGDPYALAGSSQIPVPRQGNPRSLGYFSQHWWLMLDGAIACWQT